MALAGLDEFSTQPRVSQHGERTVAACDVLPQWQEWQFHAGQHDVIIVRLRIPQGCFTLAGEPDDEPDNGGGQKWHFEDALAAPLDRSQDQRMGMGDQAAAPRSNADVVVADEPCEQARLSGGGDQGESQAAFAGAGWPAN